MIQGKPFESCGSPLVKNLREKLDQLLFDSIEATISIHMYAGKVKLP